MSTSAHPEDVRLQDYVDGRLTAAEASDVRAHLQACAECRAVCDDLASAREALMSMRDEDILMPADLLASVQRALDAESATGATAPVTPHGGSDATRASAGPDSAGPQSRRRRGLWLAAAAAAAALVAYIALGDRTVPLDLPAQAARDLGAVGSRSLPFGLVTSEAAALERYFADAPAGPRVRVIDLGMMNIPLEGGVRHVLAGRPSALYAYRTPSGARLVCQMYEGLLADLPAPESAFDDKGFHFQTYTRDGITVVFWQEGRLVCVLASDLPAAEVIALAVAKAMSPAGS